MKPIYQVTCRYCGDLVERSIIRNTVVCINCKELRQRLSNIKKEQKVIEKHFKRLPTKIQNYIFFESIMGHDGIMRLTQAGMDKFYKK